MLVMKNCYHHNQCFLLKLSLFHLFYQTETKGVYLIAGRNRGSYNGNNNVGRANGNLNGNRVNGSDVGNQNGNSNQGVDNGNANGNG